MKKQAYALLHEALFIWMLLFLEILVAVAIYIGLRFSGLQEPTNIIVTSILAAILSISSIIVFFNTPSFLKNQFLTRKQRTKSKNQGKKDIISPLDTKIEDFSAFKHIPLEKASPIFAANKFEISQLTIKIEKILEQQAEEMRIIESLKKTVLEQQEIIRQMEKTREEETKTIVLLKSVLETSLSRQDIGIPPAINAELTPFIARGGINQTASFWNPQIGEKLSSLRKYGDYIRSVAFSPDGKWLASGSNDLTIRLWDLQTGDTLHTFRGHSGLINSIVFSPDGKWLASVSTDQTIRLWDPQTGKELRTLREYSDSISLSSQGSADITIKRSDGSILIAEAKNYPTPAFHSLVSAYDMFHELYTLHSLARFPLLNMALENMASQKLFAPEILSSILSHDTNRDLLLILQVLQSLGSENPFFRVDKSLLQKIIENRDLLQKVIDGLKRHGTAQGIGLIK